MLTSCRAKASIVQADETEKGSRALLNLGHTFGHALEAQTGYSNALNHGEAVAIGLGLAFDLSVRMGLCPGEDRDRLRGHLAAVGLPVGLDGLTDGGWSAAGLIDLMGQDKKVVAGRITFVLARGIGAAFLEAEVDLDGVRDVIAQSHAEDVSTP